MQSILEEVRAVHESVRSIPTPPLSPARSWAQLAATATPPPLLASVRPASPSETSEITVRIGEAIERQAVAELSNEVIVQKMRQAHPNAASAVAVRKVPSGDVRIYLADKAAKKALLQEPGWTSWLGQSSSTTEILIQVAIYGVRLDSLDPANTGDVASLQEQNKTLHPGLRIARAKWMNTQRKPEQRYGSLVLGLPDAQMANCVIRRGLIHSFALHTAEYYSLIGVGRETSMLGKSLRPVAER
ncbi:Hypothetical protein D9617_51g088940 [Elsinoe fawcettii]|nr:Hypothetical protein D9617_51g088940 [Elsinoe fawcettii]